MNITIAGCGIVGTALAEKLTAEKHAVTVIDNNEAHLSYIMNSLDVLTILGDASAPDVLEEANVGGSDLMISVTDSDEKNLLISLVSKQLGVKNTIARVRGPQNTKSAGLLKEVAGMSMAINPEMDAAREIMNSLKYKSTQQVETIAKGTTEVLTCVVKPDTPIVNKKIMDLQKTTGTKVLVCGLKRGEQVFIPTAQTEIHAGDTLSFVASNRDALTFFKKLKYDTARIENIAIIGGSKIGVYLAQMAMDIGIPVTIVDKNRPHCEYLHSLLSGANIICGDASDTDLLDEEGILEHSVVVAATEDDATNIMLALYVSKMAPDTKVITKVKKSDFEDMIINLNIGTVFNPKYITVDHIVRYVRGMQNSIDNEVESVFHVINNKVEVLEFNIHEGMPNINKPLKQVNFRKNLLIATIYREGRAFIPNGDDMMMPGDMMIVATTDTGIGKFREIFA